MSRGAVLIDAMLGVARRDAQLFWSYRLRAVSQTFALLFSLTVFFYVSKLVRVAPFTSPGAYFAWVAVGLVILTVLTATLTAVPLAVRQELVAGTFERFVVSPTGAAAGVAAMLLFPLASSVVLGGTQLLIATIVFGLDLHWSTAFLAFPVGVLAALAFAPFALGMAAAVVVVKQISGGVTFITTGLAFLGGFFFPVALLPGWIRWASEVQPFTPALELLRHLLVGTPMTQPALTSLARIAAFAVVGIPVGAFLLVRAVRTARARGTLIEY
jgi:ABC-2 type transport system permease protein